VATAVVTRDAFIWLFKALPVLPSLFGSPQSPPQTRAPTWADSRKSAFKEGPLPTDHGIMVLLLTLLLDPPHLDLTRFRERKPRPVTSNLAKLGEDVRFSAAEEAEAAISKFKL
jgi:hypothetical protein